MAVTSMPESALGNPWRPRLGFEAGSNLGFERFDPLSFGEEKWQLGGQALLIASWDPFPGWGIEAGPGWERLSARFDDALVLSFDDGSGNEIGFRVEGKQTTRFDRLVFPLRWVYHPGRSGPAFEGGLSGAWLGHVDRRVQARVTIDGEPFPVGSPARGVASPNARIFEDVHGIPTDVTSQYHRWEWSAVGGAGWNHGVGDHTLRLRVRWREGLTDINRYDVKIHLRAAAITLGCLW